MIWTNKQKEAAAEAIVAARDFCGDELAAVRQYADDNGLKFPTTQIGAIQHRADQIWRKNQKAAGVKAKYWV